MGDYIMENRKEMPSGFAFQLAMNESAMEAFSNMTDVEKRQVLEAARSASSKEQMKSIVEDLGQMG